MRHRRVVLRHVCVASVLLASCRSGGDLTVDAVADPAGSARDARRVVQADSIESLRRPLLEQLMTRAERDDAGRADADDEWDDAVNLALAVRARIELLHSGAVPASRAASIRGRAQEGARVLIEYEARGARGARHCSGSCQQGRGWGTSKPIRMGSLAVEGGVIDAYSTGVVLGAVADVIDDGSSQVDSSRARGLHESAFAVADDWITSRMFQGPGGGPSFEKFVSRSAEMRRYMVFNTDALLARALLVLAGSARKLGDLERAQRYERSAGGVASMLRRWILEPVASAAPSERAPAWRYGLALKDGGRVDAQRVEDTNHASFTLDFIALAVERRLGAEPGLPPVFQRVDLERLGSLLREVAFPRRADGMPAYQVFVAGSEVKRGARGKTTTRDFALVPDGERGLEVVSWWKELGGEPRSLDLGLSIRTSWGWAEAVAHDERVLIELGRYLALAARDPVQQNARNLFLAQAVWARVAAR